MKTRITRYGDADPRELRAHARNWRTHPERQRRALRAALDELGVVQTVVVNERTGTIVDGHLRVELAIEDATPTVPVTYIDVDEDDELKLLATFDAVGELAIPDTAMLAGIVDSVDFADPELARMLATITLAPESDTYDDASPGGTYDDRDQSDEYADIDEIESEYSVLITCSDEQQQRELLARFQAEGLACRPLIA